MAAYCQVYGVIHATSPAGLLLVHRDQLRAQRSVTSMEKLYLLPLHVFLYILTVRRQPSGAIHSDVADKTAVLCTELDRTRLQRPAGRRSTSALVLRL